MRLKVWFTRNAFCGSGKLGHLGKGDGGVGIEGEIGWIWFHLCTSMIAPTVYKNAQAPFELKRFEEVENKYVIACICVLYLYLSFVRLSHGAGATAVRDGKL